jgi:hypothetical protein
MEQARDGPTITFDKAAPERPAGHGNFDIRQSGRLGRVTARAFDAASGKELWVAKLDRSPQPARTRCPEPLRVTAERT